MYQGSPISPLLFNIYMEEFLRILKERIEIQKYLVYADDLVIIIDHTSVTRFLNELYILAEDFHLIINPKKSSIIPIKNHTRLSELTETDLHQIPITNEYCYLGILINSMGSVSPQFSKIMQRSSYLAKCFKRNVSRISYENQYLIWNAYIRPYFQYVAQII